MAKLLVALMMVGLLLAGTAAYAEGEAAGETVVLFGFEDNTLQGWDIPDWAYEKPDHVQQSVGPSDKFASEGKGSLEMQADFPGGKWTGAIVEIMQYFDWSNYGKIEADIYIPAGAPEGLKGSMILTVGDEWKWVEMSRAFSLVPGQWTTITADLKPGSIDWRRIQVDEAFRKDVRKVDIRVFSNNVPAYTGPIYIDNVRVVK